MSRYHVSSSEGQYEKDSDEQVLANKLGIAASNEMDEAELVLLEQLYQSVFEEQFPEGHLSVAMLKSWHRRWLGNIYEWAGQERAVNISKGGFMFAAAPQIPRLLADFERSCLARWTPCHGMDTDTLAEAMAITHVEFILIHPFREGNGRLSRLLADVMAVQSGRGPLDYSAWNAHKTAYIQAIHQGVEMNYAPMKQLFVQALNAGQA